MARDWKKTLAAVAPSIATALGGPMAGVAVSIAAKALGMDPAKTDEGALQAAIMSGDTNILLKLKEADQNFKIEMKRLEVDIHRIDSTDRDSARKLAMAKGLIPQVIISSIFMCGFVWVLGLIFNGEVIPEEMREPAMYLLGILSAGIMQIMNFWFGSSSGSKEKDLNMAAKPV